MPPWGRSSDVPATRMESTWRICVVTRVASKNRSWSNCGTTKPSCLANPGRIPFAAALRTRGWWLALVQPRFSCLAWCVSEMGRAFELAADRRPAGCRADHRTQCAGANAARDDPGPAGGWRTVGESCPDQAAAWNEVVAGMERLLRGERVQPGVSITIRSGATFFGATGGWPAA